MKKLLLGLLTSLILSATSLWVFSKYYLDPKITNWINTEAPKLAEAEVKVSKVTTQIIPFQILFEQLTFNKNVGEGPDKKTVRASFRQIKAKINVFGLLSKKIAAELEIEKPEIEVEFKPEPKKAPPSDQVQTVVETKFDIDRFKKDFAIEFLLRINDLDTKVLMTERKIEIQKADLTGFIEGWNKPVQIKTGFDLQISSPKLNLPIFFESVFSLSGEEVDFSHLALNVGGLETKVKGQINYSSFKQNWDIQSKIPQIGSLGTPLHFDCATLKAGGVDLNLKFSTAEKFQSPRASGQVLLTSINGELNCLKEEASVVGNVKSSTSIDFEYGPELKLKLLKSATDLADLNIEKKGLFVKKKQAPMSFDIEAYSQGSVFQIKSFIARLERLKLMGNGVVSSQAGQRSEVNMRLDKASLAGIENMFPILAGQPVNGDLEFVGKISGDLTQPMGLDVEVSPIKLKGFKASLNYTSQDKTMSVHGPVVADVEGTIKAHGSNLNEAKVSLSAEMSSLKLDSPYLIKTAGQPLSLTVLAQQKGNRISITQGGLRIPGGMISLTGSVASPARPELDLQFTSKSFDLGTFLKSVPMAKAYRFDQAAVTSRMRLFGTYDFKLGIEKSPLSLTGDGKLNVAKITIPEKPKPKTKEGAGAAVVEEPVSDAPMLDPWVIYKNSDLRFESDIKQVQYADLPIQGIKTKHIFKAGIISSTGLIQSIFGGVIQLSRSQMSLITKAPRLTMAGFAKGVQLAQVNAWLSPKWKDVISGAANGNFAFDIAHRSQKDYLKLSTGSGDFLLANGYLNTIKFDQLANEKLSKLPGMSDRQDLKIKSGGARGNMSGKFNLKDGRMNIVDFDFKTPEKDEMKANGWVSLDTSMDLQSQLYLVDPPVKGSIRQANSDSSGRFVLPVRFKGSVFSPEIDISNETAKVLLEKTAKFEGDRLKKQVEVKAREEGQKIQENLKNEAEKKIKDLFK